MIIIYQFSRRFCHDGSVVVFSSATTVSCVKHDVRDLQRNASDKNPRQEVRMGSKGDF